MRKRRVSLENAVKPDEQSLIVARVFRALSLPPTRLAVRLGLSANAVTLAGGSAWMLSLPATVYSGMMFAEARNFAGWGWLLAAAFLWNAGYVLDLVDGNVARIRGTCSYRGFYLDYVFHLLFKPAFLAALGMFLALAMAQPAWLLWAVSLIPANWCASESAVEHVLAQSFGKGSLQLDAMSGRRIKSVFIGDTDIMTSAEDKGGSLVKTAGVIVQESLSYYGQFTFFSLLVAGDALLSLRFDSRFVLLRAGLLLVGGIMLLRVPFRLRREFSRIGLLDQ